jgi:hypothetical protein
VIYSVMIDAISSNVANVPASAGKVAGYVTGTPDIQWTAADWARFPRAGHVRIDQSPDLASWISGAADVADIENGAGTQESAVAGALARKKRGWLSFIYVAQGNFAAMKDAVNAAGLSGVVSYWVANWDLSEAEAAAALTGDVAAVQWASPSSNPLTVVPGGSQTLAEANVDLSVTLPGWFEYASPVTTATPGVVITPALKTYSVVSDDLITWKAA